MKTPTPKVRAKVTAKQEAEVEKLIDKAFEAEARTRAKIRPGLIAYHGEMERPAIILRTQPDHSIVYVFDDGSQWTDSTSNSGLIHDFDLPPAGSTFDLIADDVAAALARHGCPVSASSDKMPALQAAVARAMDACGAAVNAIVDAQNTEGGGGDDPYHELAELWSGLVGQYEAIGNYLVEVMAGDSSVRVEREARRRFAAVRPVQQSRRRVTGGAS